MAWCRPGDKPLSEAMMVRLPTHICLTQHQWVNEGSCSFTHPIVKGPRSWIRYVKHWCQDGDWHGLSIVMHVTAWSREYHQDYSFATKIHTVMIWSLSGVDLLLLSTNFHSIMRDNHTGSESAIPHVPAFPISTSPLVSVAAVSYIASRGTGPLWRESTSPLRGESTSPLWGESTSPLWGESTSPLWGESTSHGASNKKIISMMLWCVVCMGWQRRYSGLILGLHPANERWCYFVTTSLIGWVQA